MYVWTPGGLTSSRVFTANDFGGCGCGFGGGDEEKNWLANPAVRLLRWRALTERFLRLPYLFSARGKVRIRTFGKKTLCT